MVSVFFGAAGFGKKRIRGPFAAGVAVDTVN
jgi:hypothetical protein